jgi:hypothetical protein
MASVEMAYLDIDASNLVGAVKRVEKILKAPSATEADKVCPCTATVLDVCSLLR